MTEKVKLEIPEDLRDKYEAAKRMAEGKSWANFGELCLLLPFSEISTKYLLTYVRESTTL